MRKLVILAAAAAVATAGFGRTAEAWKAERDVKKAKVYVAEDATMPEIEAAKLILRAQVVIAGGADTTNVAPLVAKELPKDGIVVGWMGSALVKPLAAKFGLKPWRECLNGTDQIVQTFVGDTLVLAGNGPEGAFYAWVYFDIPGMDSMQICEYLMEHAGVVGMPGSAYGEEAACCMRFSNTFSATTDVPRLSVSSAIICACMSVGKPG